MVEEAPVAGQPFGPPVRNSRLLEKVHKAGLSASKLARMTGIDERTITRWLNGEAKPQRPNAEAAAQALGCEVAELWPGLFAGALVPEPGTIPVQVYPSRADVPIAFWKAFFNEANEQIDLCVFGGTFLFDTLPNFKRLMTNAVERGAKVRFAVGDPGSAAVHQRGIEEGIGDSLAGRCRMTLNRAEALAQQTNIEIHTHSAPLYVSMFRADNVIVANHHILGSPASDNPVIVISRHDAPDLWDQYQTSFERIWSQSKAVHYPI